MSNIDKEVAQLKEDLKSCDNTIIGRVDEATFQSLISSPDLESEQLLAIFNTYIDNDDHLPDGCFCDDKNIGKHFAKVLANKTFGSDWTALHYAVRPNDRPLKQQAIVSLIEENKGLLGARNTKGETALTFAIKRRATTAMFLLHKFPEILNDDNIEDMLKTSFTCQKRKQKKGAVDISEHLLSKLSTTSISTLVACLNESTCPVSVAIKISDKLALNETQDKQGVFDLLKAMLNRTKGTEGNLNKVQMKTMLRQVDEVSKGLLSKDVCYILRSLSKIVNKETNKDLFNTLYMFLEQSADNISFGAEDGKNLAHYACNEKNYTILNMLPKDQVDIMFSLCDNRLKTPLSSKEPLKLLNKLEHQDEKYYSNEVCFESRKTLIHHALTLQYDDEEFEGILKCSNETLVKCDKYGNTVLHYMLSSSSCEEDKLEQMIARLTDTSVSVNTVNSQGYTPLHLLCRYSRENEDEAVECIKVLVRAGANVNANLASHRQVSPVWILKMRQEKGESDTDFDMILAELKSQPQYIDQSEEFTVDVALFDALTLLNDLTVAQNQRRGRARKYTIINLVGDYDTDTAETSDTCILVQIPPAPCYLLYALQHCNLEQNTTYITPALSGTLLIRNSVPVPVSELQDQLADCRGNVALTPLQLDVLRFIRDRLHLKHVSGRMFSKLEAVQITHTTMDKALYTDYTESNVPCLEGQFEECLLRLGEAGVLCILPYKDTRYLVNLPVLLEVVGGGETDPVIQRLQHVLGIPGVPAASNTQQISEPLTHLLDVRLVNAATGSPLDPHVVFEPLWTTLAHVLGAAVNMNGSVVMLHLPLVKIELQLLQDNIAVLCSDKQYIENLKLVLGHVGSQLQLQTLDVNLVLQLDDKFKDTPIKPAAVDITSKHWIERISLSGERQTKLLDYVDLNHDNIRDTFGISGEDDERIKLCAELRRVRLLYELNNQIGSLTLQQFYRKYKDDDELFVEKVLEVFEKQPDEMVTLGERCMQPDILWWTVTIVISVFVTVIVVLLSVLCEMDVGLTGLAAIPAIFTVSFLLKKFYCKQGNKYASVEDEQVKEICGGLKC